MRAVIFLVLLWPIAARAEPNRIGGRVVDQAGRPVAGVPVFAADAASDTLVAMGLSDEAGRLELVVPRRRHNFGILSSKLGIIRYVPLPQGFELVVTPLPASAVSQRSDLGASWFGQPRASVLRGRIVDETGAPLPGVRVEVVRKTGHVTAAVVSNRDGAFGVFLPQGESLVRAAAPGLETVRTSRQGIWLVIMMGVSAGVQTVTIRDRTLTFRPDDSIDPGYSPPAVVRAYLAFAYGICPRTAPLKAHERAALRKYWYLDVLRSQPPNPATISSAACVPAFEYPLPPGQTRVEGFDTWRESITGAGE
jgi:hypothetical protein